MTSDTPRKGKRPASRPHPLHDPGAFNAVMADCTREATASPEAARRTLVRIGILTRAGRLSKNYRQVHRLSTSFVPGCHGCDMAVADALLAGEAFRPGENAHDRLGHGVYFWEANPKRGLDFTRVSARHAGSSIKAPAVVGAATDLSLCLGLTSSHGLDLVAAARGALTRISAANGAAMPVNSPDGLRRNLDCAVVNLLHDSLATRGEAPFDTVTGIFVEGTPMYPGLGFHARTHVQVCVRTLACIRGVFRVPAGDLA